MPRLPYCKSDEEERLSLSPEERGLERGGASPYGKERTGEVAKNTEINIIIIISRNFCTKILLILESSDQNTTKNAIRKFPYGIFIFIVQRSSFIVQRSSFIVNRSTKLQQSQLTDEIKHAISERKAYNTYDKTNLNHVVLLDEVG